ncbi:retrovirus-related pol polyprotein from transposon TNT 1-94 [Tanacetum coccineum]
MTMMFISVFAAARMMLLFYVAVVFASEVIMFEYGFDAARMVILLYVAVLFSSELHSSEWGFDAAIFSFVFLLWIIMLLRYTSCLDAILLLLYTLLYTYCYGIKIPYHILLSTFVPNKRYISDGLMKAWSFKKKTLKCGPFRLHKLKPKPKLVVGKISMIAQINRITAAREWYLDSGATIHVVGSRNSFTTYHAVTGRQLMMANRDKADVYGVGMVQMKFTSGKTVTLHNVLHVPTISKSLVSVGKLDEHGFKIVIESKKVVITKRGLFVGKGYYQEGMYQLNVENESPKNVSDSNITTVSNQISHVSLRSNFDSVADLHVHEINQISVVYPVFSLSLWHKRLAHINVKNIEKMKSNGLIRFQNKNFKKCETCVKSKFIKKPFPAVKRDTGLSKLIHSDICELNGILTRGGKRYFITFCDDSSRFLYVYLLRSKDEAFDSFKIYKAEVENQLRKKIKILQSDRGGEYFTREFDTLCEENGIKHERTSPYTPQQNGLAERKNQTLIEMVNCMLNQSGLLVLAI